MKTAINFPMEDMVRAIRTYRLRGDQRLGRRTTATGSINPADFWRRKLLLTPRTRPNSPIKFAKG